MATKTYTLKQGALFQTSVELNKEAFDWTGVVVRCHLFDRAGKKVEELTVDTLSNSVGQMVVQLTGTGTQTAKWPVQQLVGDIEVSRITPAFGPYIVADIIVEVKKQRT